MNENMLKVMIQVDGNWLEANSTGIELNVETGCGEYQWFRAMFVNRSERPVRIGNFRFDLQAFKGIPGERIRFYREGWTMTSSCASVRYGERDFEVNPEYLKFAVSAPSEYDSNTPNRFSGEHVVVLNDRNTDYSLLAGFISSADQFTRFTIELNEQGVSHFTAYSCVDGIEVNPGETVVSEELVIMDGGDGYGLLQRFADIWGKRMQALTWDHAPTGWCSWYYYFGKVTENDIMENIGFLADHKREFPLEYIQLDEGYEAALGDWLICNEKFPQGLRSIAGKVSEAGFKPGIWLAPFMVEERSKLFAEHPDWMVKDADGKIIWASEWRGNRVAALDGTHPESQAYLNRTFTTMVEWGFEYFKLDFLSWACVGSGGCYHDRKATRAQALRRGLQSIRNAIGERFMLGCTAPLGQAAGLVNGERIGTDITPYWKPEGKIFKEAPTVPNVCRNIINRSYMHGRLWLNDPDVHIARSSNNKLSEDEVILWTSALLLVGGMTLFSDRFSELTPERTRLSQLLLHSADAFGARPLDFFEREYPSVWLGRKKAGAKSAIASDVILGLFNFDDTPLELHVDLRAAGIAPGISRIHDFWADQAIPPAGLIIMTVPPRSCKLLLVG